MNSDKPVNGTVADWLGYLTVKSFIFFSALLPKSFVYYFFRILTLTFYYLSKRRRDITKDNLQQAFPSKSEQEIDTLSIEVFTELSKTIAEILFMLSDRFDIDKAIMNQELALEKLSSIKKAHPQGWIIMTAHFSNWELAAHLLAKHGYPMLAVGRAGDNPLIDQKITIPFREKYGSRSVYKKNAAISIFKTLKRGDIVGVLIDQKVQESEGVKVKFFGRDVYTTSIVATMKDKLDIVVVPIFLARVENGKYNLIVGDPIEERGDKTKMTQAYNNAMEKIIEKYPSQWFWMHNRWKMNR